MAVERRKTYRSGLPKPTSRGEAQSSSPVIEQPQRPSLSFPNPNDRPEVQIPEIDLE